jgi:hypothetical protein
MLIRLIKSFTRKTTTAPLGRWNTIVKEEEPDIHVKNAIERNAFWGNHDHCGSEICKTPIPPKKEELEKIIKDSKWNDPYAV